MTDKAYAMTREALTATGHCGGSKPPIGVSLKSHSFTNHARARRQHRRAPACRPECRRAGEAWIGCLCQLRGSRQCPRGCFGFDVRHSFWLILRLKKKNNWTDRKHAPRIANAFTKVVTSFVSDIVLPTVSLLPFLNRNLDQKFAVLSQGPNYIPEEGYNTIKQARDDGALVLAYGYVDRRGKPSRISLRPTRDVEVSDIDAWIQAFSREFSQFPWCQPHFICDRSYIHVRLA